MSAVQQSHAPSGSSSSHLPPGSPTDPFASIDPTLHGATLDSVSRTQGGSGDLGEDANRLNDFARHVLTDGPERAASDHNLLGYEGDGDGSLYTQPPAQEFTELLDATRREQEHGDTRENGHGGRGGAEGSNGERGGLTQREQDELNRMEVDQLDGEPLEFREEHVLEQPGEGPPPPPPERSRRGKRKRDTPEIVPVVNDNGEEIDSARLKKDSHKEVERRRRENINDGILEIAKHVPGGCEKMGKGTFLRKAADRLAEVTIKADLWDAEQTNKAQGDGELHVQLHRVQMQLEDEQARSMRYETSWREAEDRAAASQFELARVQGELDEMKRHFEAET